MPQKGQDILFKGTVVPLLEKFFHSGRPAHLVFPAQTAPEGLVGENTPDRLAELTAETAVIKFMGHADKVFRGFPAEKVRDIRKLSCDVSCFISDQIDCPVLRIFFDQPVKDTSGRPAAFIIQHQTEPQPFALLQRISGQLEVLFSQI